MIWTNKYLLNNCEIVSVCAHSLTDSYYNYWTVELQRATSRVPKTLSKWGQNRQCKQRLAYHTRFLGPKLSKIFIEVAWNTIYYLQKTAWAKESSFLSHVQLTCFCVWPVSWSGTVWVYLWQLEIDTGMGISAVFWKQVVQVWVWCAKCWPVAIPQPVLWYHG